jgi:hypothetical protein
MLSEAVKVTKLYVNCFICFDFLTVDQHMTNRMRSFEKNISFVECAFFLMVLFIQPAMRTMFYPNFV